MSQLNEENFDWEYYLQLYPEIKNVGIDTKNKVWHYLSLIDKQLLLKEIINKNVRIKSNQFS